MDRKHVRGARSLVAVAFIMGSFILWANVAEAGAGFVTTIVVPGPVGPAQVCLDDVCKDVSGIKNLTVTVNVELESATPPSVTISSSGTCTLNVNKLITVTTAGAAGTINVTESFQRVEFGSPNMPMTMQMSQTKMFGVDSQSHTVKVCAATPQ